MIFGLQRELADLIRENEKSSPTTADQCIALMHEVMELHDETNWKWWKRGNLTPSAERKENAKTELVDIVHFVVQIALNLGMTPADLFDDVP